MCGLTRKDRLRNEKITETVKLGKKIQESRMRWFGHVERRDKSYIGKKVEERNGSKSEKRAREIKEKVEELCESGSA
ncbi:hypothetical protein WDU94_006702 [Cyamophila willieti]